MHQSSFSACAPSVDGEYHLANCTKLAGCLQWVAGAGKHIYIVRLQAATERPVRLPSLHPICLPAGRVLLQRPSLRGGARHRWNFLLSSGPTEFNNGLVGGSFTDIEKDVNAASTTACQCPPRSATRLPLAQPEASLVMVLEFFFCEGSSASAQRSSPPHPMLVSCKESEIPLFLGRLIVVGWLLRVLRCTSLQHSLLCSQFSFRPSHLTAQAALVIFYQRL